MGKNMKIKFNDFESMQVRIKEDYEFIEFEALTQRFVQIVKIGKKDFVIEQNIELNKDEIKEEVKTKRKYVKSGQFTSNRNPRGKPNAWFNNKAMMIKCLKIHYFGTKEHKQEFLREIGSNKTWSELSKSFSYSKKKLNILPKELGLKRFPTTLENLSKDERKKLLMELKI
jgi:hypothetical protein